jgi:hypothetical protein
MDEKLTLVNIMMESNILLVVVVTIELLLSVPSFVSMIVVSCWELSFVDDMENVQEINCASY